MSTSANYSNDSVNYAGSQSRGRNCMSEDDMEESLSERVKTHVVLFIGIVVALRALRYIGNLMPSASSGQGCTRR